MALLDWRCVAQACVTAFTTSYGLVCVCSFVHACAVCRADTAPAVYLVDHADFELLVQ